MIMGKRCRTLTPVLLGAIVLSALPRFARAQSCATTCQESRCAGPLWAVTNSCSNGGMGIQATSSGSNVYGLAFGVDSHSTNGAGVAGHSGSGNGVFGKSSSAFASGVYARNNHGYAYGAAGRTNSWGVAVLGDNTSSSGYALYLNGKGYVAGYLSKAGGGFLIDHPAKPGEMKLLHSFVESPEMKNVYDGITVLGPGGEAVVKLPAYFERLNRDFRYQVGTIGTFAPVYVSSEVKNGEFVISGGKAGVKVSWQVTGVRKDPWALRNQAPVEQPKAQKDIGSYLNPEAFDEPESRRYWPLAARPVAPPLPAFRLTK